jgi:hypothetical protein
MSTLRIQLFFCPCLLMLITIQGIAQDNHKLQTRSKTIQQEIPLSSLERFSVAAEKAEVTLIGWDKDFVSLKLVFTAAHADGEIAQQDLDIMQYALSREDKTFEVSNTFALPAGREYVRSRLQVTLEVKVPKGLKIFFKDKYGAISLNGMTGDLSADLEFCDVHIEQLVCNVKMTASYCHIDGTIERSDAFYLRTDNSQISLELMNGKYKFDSKLSTLDCVIHDLKGLTIASVRSNVKIKTDNSDRYDYRLKNTQGRIYLPTRFAAAIKHEEGETLFSMRSTPIKPLIDISTTYNTITVK